MPFQLRGAQRASLGTLRSSRIWLLALSLALIAPILPGPHGPTPSARAAAARCGGWASRLTPPTTIRVLRTSTGAVEQVHFPTYVATVMASGEWPTWLPPAALEAGATATKQYAWYYLLKGNHRASYRTPAGVCYDVRDDTNDQLYRPESARPTQKQLDALAATWALSVRKNDRFFLTGYRAGGRVGCARDTDGWRLYAGSVARCARQGWSRQRIQEAYYAPRVSFVWDRADLPAAAGDTAGSGSRDRLAPLVIAPVIRLRKRATLGGTDGLVTWAGADAGSGVGSYRLQRRDGDGPWRDVRLTSPRARQAAVSIDARQRVQFRVRARDAAGHVSPWATSRSAVPVVRQSGDAKLDRAWNRVAVGSASGDSLHRATRVGTAVSLRFVGRGVAIVAPTGPGKGVARIRVAGLPVATIDLGALPAGPRRLIWARVWHDQRQRRVGLVVRATPGRRTVDVDAFLVLR